MMFMAHSRTLTQTKPLQGVGLSSYSSLRYIIYLTLKRKRNEEKKEIKNTNVTDVFCSGATVETLELLHH